MESLITQPQAAQPLTTPSRAFILGLTDAGGHLDGAVLYALADAAGFSDTKIRLALRRLGESGLITVEGRGRSATMTLTDLGLAARAPDVAWTSLAYRLDAGLVAWDERWHLVSFEIPESRRAARDALRSRLIELLAAPVGGGLYASTYAIEAWIGREAARHQASEYVSMMTCTSISVGTARSHRDVARRLWPLDELEATYRELLNDWATILSGQPPDIATAVRIAFEASADFEKVLRRDPLLPASVAPPGFAASEARRTFRELLNHLGTHDEIKRANIFSSYLDAIEVATSMSERDFNASLFAATSTSESPS